MLETENEITVTAVDVSHYTRITGRVVPALCEVLQRKVTVKAAREAGIDVSVAELQKAADCFRFAYGFHKATDTKNWLRSNAIPIEALEEHLETNLLIGKFRDYLVEKARRRESSELPVGDDSASDKIYRDWLEKQFK